MAGTSFLDLPGELRNVVYDLVLEQAPNTITLGFVGNSLWPQAIHPPALPHRALATTAVNQQLHQETAGTFFAIRKYKWIIPVFDDIGLSEPAQHLLPGKRILTRYPQALALQWWLRSIGPKSCVALKTMDVDLGVWNLKWDNRSGMELHGAFYHVALAIKGIATCSAGLGIDVLVTMEIEIEVLRNIDAAIPVRFSVSGGVDGIKADIDECVRKMLDDIKQAGIEGKGERESLMMMYPTWRMYRGKLQKLAKALEGAFGSER